MKSYSLVLAGFAILVGAGGGAAQDTEWSRYTLEDLGGVYVTAEVADACAAAGVMASGLTSDAEAVLTGSEIELLTEVGMLAHPALPELTVVVSCAAGDGALAYTVEVRLHQAVQMVRDPQITHPEAVTWYSTSVGVVGSAEAGASIAEAVKGRVGAFASAYVAANAG